MSYSDIASYFMTLIAIALAPGPIVLMLIVKSASGDVSGALGFAVGYALGGLLINSAVWLGFGAWLSDAPQAFEYSKYVMMAYIFWLAYGIWKGTFDLTQERTVERRPILPSLGAGSLTCFISPYMILLFPLVLPSLVDIATLGLTQFLIVAVLTFTALFLGAGLLVAFAAQISRLARSPRSMMILNRCLAGILVLGGGWIAFV
jgi:threonine/homoserine/homoserine lactone efflux protein